MHGSHMPPRQTLCCMVAVPRNVLHGKERHEVRTTLALGKRREFLSECE